jgi:hypothetical protein
MATKIPSYCHHKSRDLALVRIDGQFHYLGKYGSQASRQEYDALIGAWRVRAGRRGALLPAAAHRNTAGVRRRGRFG